MRAFLAKIARLAVSKGAAFCYAVTVGVSGQLAYNYLQPRDPAPNPVAVAAPAASRDLPSGAAVVAPIPGTTLPGTAASPAAPTSAPAADAKPASAPSAVTAPILPEPSSLSLPTLAALPAPALKPASLPPSRPVAVTPIEPSDAPQTIEIPDTALAAPIPLLPSAGAAEAEKAPIPVKPGPGSGGLY